MDSRENGKESTSEGDDYAKIDGGSGAESWMGAWEA
jgi:hypothetical protein